MRRLAALCTLAACAGTPPAKPVITSTPTAPAPAPRWIAVVTGEDGTFALLKVSGGHVDTVASDLPGGMFGWVDEHTLVVVGQQGTPDPGLEITQYVDGKRGDRSSVSEKEWPGQTFVKALLTGSNELWVSKCGGGDCGVHDVYRRVLPTPSPDQDHPPDGVDAGRVLDRDENPWPRPPAATAPAGIAIATGQVDVLVTDPYQPDHPTKHVQEHGASCDAHGKRLTYPQTEWDTGFDPDQVKRAVRWVSSDPPVFEIAEDWINPAGFHGMTYAYARACEPALDGYGWLGGDLWASFALASHDPPNGFGPGEPPRTDGDWTFHAGDKVIGTIHGYDYLRANVIAR
jgi:hypothetical protein